MGNMARGSRKCKWRGRLRLGDTYYKRVEMEMVKQWCVGEDHYRNSGLVAIYGYLYRAEEGTVWKRRGLSHSTDVLC